MRPMSPWFTKQISWQPWGLPASRMLPLRCRSSYTLSYELNRVEERRAFSKRPQ